MFASPCSALPPIRVTMLNTAPWTLPYSADAPSCSTSTSSTTSVFGHGVELVSVPSIWYWFSFVLDPSDVALVVEPTCDVWLTTGDSCIRSKDEKLRTGAFHKHVR